eukprot:Skav222870  [mRNA]  locus=scaffold2201:391937:395047:- [translate_table: standard]
MRAFRNGRTAAQIKADRELLRKAREQSGEIDSVYKVLIFVAIAVFMWTFVVPYLEDLKLQKEKAAMGIPPTPPDHEEF